MILASTPPMLAPGGGLLLAVVALVLYLVAAVPSAPFARLRDGDAAGAGVAVGMRRASSAALIGAWVLHFLLLVVDIGGLGQPSPGARLGFGPVLSMTIWLLIAVHTIESRFLPLPSVRLALAVAGALAVITALLFPGELRPISNKLAPLHFALGVGSYGLFAAAVLHGLMLDAAERRLRGGGAAGRAGATLGERQHGNTFGMPLLQLERLTFRFVEAGFSVLTATLVLGWVSGQLAGGGLRGDLHKMIFSLLAWGVFAALLAGRRWRGWRGRRATRWLYAGAALLLLAYVGSRFVFEVLLGRAPA